MPRPAPIRPPALLPGDTVGIVAPASNIDRTALDAGCEMLRQLGYKPYYLESIFERDLYFAGSVERRVGELEHMFSNREVRAVLCARGGYGANYLLPHLDLAKILAHPKPFIGYSDITTLLTWFTDHGLVTFHGPMATKDFAVANGVDLASWKGALQGASEYQFVASEARTLVAGDTDGILYGGCLSMLVASLGTPYEIQTQNTLLFLEDVNAKPYQVDRMLMQLKLAGKFQHVRGILFGEMLDCAQPGGQDYTMEQVIERALRDVAVPIAYGLASGHVRSGNRTLPFGVLGAMHAGDEVRLSWQAAVTQGDGAPRAIGGPTSR